MLKLYLFFKLTMENKRLTRPMQAAQAELGELSKKLENYERDRAALRRTQQRSKSSQRQMDDWRWESEALRLKCDQLVQERDALRVRFEEAIVEIQQNVGIKNALLERKLVLMQKELAKRETVLGDVLNVSGLEPTALSQKMEHLLRVKNDKIQSLIAEVDLLTTAFDESIKAYEEKISQFGIPEEVVRSFRPSKK